MSALRTAYAQGQGPLLTEAKDLGRALFQSAEYAARNRTDRDFVADLYRGYLQRAPDQAGWDYWTGVAATAGREAVRQSFEGSAEFDYGVNGLSPLAPASGVPVGRDGLAGPASFDAATNRINSAGWQYDAAGNQTRAWDGAAWRRMEYDTAGRLASVKTDAGAVLATYIYGDSNARLVAREGTSRTYYSWGLGGVIAEYAETDGTTADTTPQWGKNYVYLGGRLLATQQPGGAGELVQYHHPDRLGTRLVSNAADTGYFEQATLPFGVGLAAESTGSTRRSFTTYDRSAATGLDYAVNRHYDPQQGRFTTVDPLEMGAVDLSDPQTFNLYAYCGNDPANHTDPEGLFFKRLLRGIGKIFKWVGLALAVATIVVVATIIFAPSSSFAFKAAVWILTEALLPLSTLPAIGGMVRLHGIGSPSWNPEGRGVFGNSLQSQAVDDGDVVRIYQTYYKSRWEWLKAQASNTWDKLVKFDKWIMKDFLRVNILDSRAGMDAAVTTASFIPVFRGARLIYNIPGFVSGFTRHGVQQAISRGVTTRQILDAVRHPLKRTFEIDKWGRPYIKYIGREATVAVNIATGKVNTVWRTSSRLVRKYLGGSK